MDNICNIYSDFSTQTKSLCDANHELAIKLNTQVNKQYLASPGHVRITPLSKKISCIVSQKGNTI